MSSDLPTDQMDMRARLAAARAAEIDPAVREAYALAERAGYDWYNTESSARRMAEFAGAEVAALREALREMAGAGRGRDRDWFVEKARAILAKIPGAT